MIACALLRVLYNTWSLARGQGSRTDSTVHQGHEAGLSSAARFNDPLPPRARLRYAGQQHPADCGRPRPGRNRPMDPNALIALLIGLIVLILLLAGL